VLGTARGDRPAARLQVEDAAADRPGEKAELQQAIARLQAAIRNLLAAIRSGDEAARQDASRIGDLERQIRANDDATTRARKGGKPGPVRDATVAALEKEGRRLQAAKSGAEKSQRCRCRQGADAGRDCQRLS